MSSIIRGSDNFDSGNVGSGGSGSIVLRDTPLVITYADITSTLTQDNGWWVVPRSFFETPDGAIPYVTVYSWTNVSSGSITSGSTYIALRGYSYTTVDSVSMEEYIVRALAQGYSFSVHDINSQLLIPTFGGKYDDFLFKIYATELRIIVHGYYYE